MTTPLALARNAITALTALRAVGDREPTTDERLELTLWPGWGPLAPALSVNTSGGWTAIANELDELVPAAELASARDIVDTSFYTSPAVVTAVFDLLRATGFTAGRILEPGCGSGNFMSGAPADLAIEWTGVEIDPTAARFARALNPGAEIIGQPLQKVALRSDAFDAVIGNVPFASGHIHDPAYTSGSLHEYFTLRALDAVRPGCHVIIVTSRHMIDGEHGLARIREQADLVSAVRLPSGSFDGTEVVADILVLRKRADGEAPGGWAQPMEEYYSYSSYSRTSLRPAKLTVSTGDHEAQVNAMWAEHLDCVAGTLTATSFFKSPLDVVAADPERAIREATAAAASFIEAGPELSADHDPFAGIILEDVDGRKAGSYHVVDGLVFQIVGGKLTPTTRAGAELRALIGLRDAATELIELESHPDRPDHEIAPARAAALALYSEYVTVFGALNRGTLIEGKPEAETGEPSLSWRRPLMGGFRKDPDYVAVLALEQFDQDTGEARPAPILLRRVGAHPPRATSAASAEEALAIVQGEGAGLNMARIGELIGGADEDTVLADLGDLVFRDPARRGQLTIARDYLSGDVRTKLERAVVAGQTDPSYWRNVKALEQVMPTLLGPLDIRAQLGATWITADDIRQFTAQVFGRSVRVEFTPAVALWEVDVNSAYADAEARIEYGTTRMSPYQLVACALNGKAPIVSDEVWKPSTQSYVKVRNQSETLAAEEKLRAVQERFSTWVWEDAARSARLVEEYNRRFNSHVIRRGDGSYLTFPGLDESIDLWSWQRDAVDRIVSQEKVMIGHPVGAGKTKSIICGAMTLRRMGLARKPLIVVPNHLLEQIAREAQQAYPTGRFLIASKEDLAADSRRLFAARCATGDWDAVVITHQAFTSIGVDAETEAAWLQQQKSDLRGHMQSTIGGSRGAKAIATAVRKLEERISSLRYGTRDENQVTFEQLGVDHVSVDECFPFETLVQTDRGPMPIGRIVEDGLKVLVASVDKTTGKTEYKPIHRWVKKATNEALIKISHESGDFTCTPNHPVWVEGRGYVRADSIVAGEALRTLRNGVQAQLNAEPVLFRVVQDVGVSGPPSRDTNMRDLSNGVHTGEDDADVLQLRLPSEVADAGHHDLRGMRGSLPAEALEPSILRSGMRLALDGETASGAASGHSMPSVHKGIHAREQEGDVLIGHLLEPVSGSEKGCEDLRVVQSRVSAEEASSEVLQPEVHDAFAGIGRGWSCFRETHAVDAEHDVSRRTGTAQCPHDGEQSHEQPGNAGQDEGVAFAASADVVTSEWRERTDNSSAETARGASRPADGVLYLDPASEGFVRVSSEFLLRGPRVRGGEASDRGGREKPQDEEVEIPGSTEDGGLGISRVVSVEVLERGGPQRHGSGRGADSASDGFVYNLEVADNHNYFAEGVLVSNCHMFRRLNIATRADGFSLGSSKRATDLLLKIDTLSQRYPGKPVAAFFTGTPWSNTLAETYVWQRFLQPERLVQAGVDQFDAWAATFVRYESKIEVTPDGQGFRMYRRPSVIQNVPELRLMLGAVADLITADSIGLERPNATWTNIVSEPGDEQREFVENLAARADAIRTPGAKPPRPDGEGDDNMLLVCNDGRRAALDPRLVGLDEDSTKVEDAAQKIAEHYRAGKNRAYGQSATPGNLQLVLCDIGTPRPGDNQVYGRLRARLIELGLPADGIRFVHDAKTDKARAHQFAQAREGALSVLIGSTSKVGVGTNIQTRLDVVHHLDAPWRPSDIEQREGRALRPGNLNAHVSIYRYVTRKSFDSFLWQTLERKQRFISQMYVADGAIREIEDVGEAVLNFAEVKAIAAGNPELLRQAELGSEVRRLRTMRSVWSSTVNRLRGEAEDNRAAAERLNLRAKSAAVTLAQGSDQTVPDAISFQALATVVKTGTGWGAATFRGLDVRLVQKTYGAETAERVIEVRQNYSAVASLTISRKDARKNVVDLAVLIHERVGEWFDGLASEIPRLEAAAIARNEAAFKSERAAAASVFGHVEALAQAERDLAAVEAQIAESVECRLSMVA